MDTTSTDVATSTTKMVQSGMSGTLQYLNPDYIPPSMDSKNSPLAMLARTCNSIGKDSAVTSKTAQPSQQQQSAAEKKDTRLIKSTSPGKKSVAGVDAVTSRKDPSSSVLSRHSTAAVKGRSSSSPTSSRQRTCREGGGNSRRGDGSQWAAASDSGRPLSGGGGSPASTSRTADSDHDSVDDLRSSGRHRDRQPPRQTLSPYNPSDAAPPALGLYESLRLQQEAAALQAAAVYSPFHQLLAQRHLAADPLAMYSASLQAAAVVAAAAAQANLGRLPGKDYRLGDALRPCGVDTADLISNGEVDSTLFGAAGMFPLRPPVPPVAHQHQPYTCSWLTAAGEFCAQRFSTSEELFSHLRTHVDSAASSSEGLPPTAPCSTFASGFLGAQSATLPFGGPAAAHAASLYRGKVHRTGRASRDTSSASPTSTAAAGGSLLFHAAAATSRYHPYKWTAASQLASALGAAPGLVGSDLTPPTAPALSAFLQQPSYAGLFSAQTLGAAVP